MNDLFKLHPFENDIGEFVFESFDYKTILEDAKEDKNSSLVQKIWNGILRIFEWIKQTFTRAINWIRSLFVNNNKSADQIADELNIPVDAEEMAKKLTLHLSEDNKLVFIVAPKDNNVGLAFTYLKNPKLIDEMKNLFTSMANGDLDAASITSKSFKQFLANTINQVHSKEIIVTMEELMAFQKSVNEMAELAGNITTIEIPDDTKHRGQLIAMINNANYTALQLQMAINSMMQTFKEIYSLDEKYKGAIKDKETAAMFAAKSIKGGIPSKYIAKNLMMILSNDLRGGEVNPNEPLMGQSRIVFKPNNKETVFKVALNKIGIIGNKTEAELTEKFTELGVGDCLAKITNFYHHYTAVDSEKAIPVDRTERGDVARVVARLEDVVKKNNINFVISDIHPNNVGKIGDRIVIVDYGALARIK